MNTEKTCGAPRVREIKKERIWKQELIILNNKRYYHVVHDNGLGFVDFWFKSKKDMECFCIVFSQELPNYIWTMLMKELYKYRYKVVTGDVTMSYDLHK